MEVLKKFVLNASTSSLTERDQLFQDLFAILGSDASKELPEAAYKLLGKMTYYLFPVYTTKASKENLIKLNDYIIALNVENSLKPLLSGLETQSKVYAVNSPCRSLTNQSFYGLDILNGIILSLHKHHKIDFMRSHTEEMSKLALTYANFALGSCLNLNEKNMQLAYKKLKSVLKSIAELDEILEKGVLSTENAESLTNRLLFMGLLMRFYQESNKSDRFKSLKNSTIEIYINNLIDTRVKPRRWLVKCCNYWLRYASKEDFSEKLLVDVKRSLLRNPEIVLETVGYLLEDLSIDLSDFSGELMKVLGSQLLAKDEMSQNESAAAYKYLSIQCSSLESIQAIIKHLFNVLNGGEGKLSVPTQKTAILTAIGNVSNNCCSSVQEMLGQLIQLFGDFLKMETHEATLVFALEQLNKWLKSLKLKNVSSEQATKLNAFFKTLLDNKSYTHTVKNAVFLNMVAIYSNSQMTSHIVSFAPTCISLVEKAQTTAAATNSLLVSEGLSAALLLAILLASDISLESKVPNFLNSITDIKKQTFTSEKFLFSLNEQGLINYCLLFEKLCEIYANKERVDISKFYLGYVFVLLSPSYKVRRFAQDTLKKLLKWNSNKMLITFFESIEPCLLQFGSLSQTDGAQATASASDSGGGGGGGSTTSGDSLLKWPSNKGLCESLLTLCSTPNLTQAELDSTVQLCLMPASLSRARTVDPDLFEKCVRRLIETNKSNLGANLTFDRLLGSQIDSLIDVSLRASTPTDSLGDKELNACQTLCSLDPTSYLTRAINYALGLLDSTSRLRTCTKQEWEIMRVREGDVYDRSLVDATIKQMQEGGSQNANLKRENKAYSYKEQMADVELRKELEAKKGGAKKLDASTLTLDQIRSHMSKKQQEMLDAQIASEKRIRLEMQQIDAIANKAASILTRAIHARPVEVKCRLASIMRTFTRLLRSPVAVGYVVNVLKEIVRKAFAAPSEPGYQHSVVVSFYDSVIYATLRLVDAPIAIESAWKQEAIDKCFKRLISGLRVEISKDYDEFDLDLAKLAFLYPFLRHASFNASIDETCLRDLIEIVAKFATYRNSSQNELLIELKANNYTLDDESRGLLKQTVNNFLSSEYFVMLMGLIQLVNDRKMSIQLQFQAAQVCRSMFEFSAHFVFASEQLGTMLGARKQAAVSSNKSSTGEANEFEFLSNYNNDVREACDTLANPIVTIRETALDCLAVLINDKNMTELEKKHKFELEDTIYEHLSHRLVIACFDEQEENRSKAKSIWSAGGFETSEPLCLLVLNDLVHPAEHVRLAAAESLADMLKNKHMKMFGTVLEQILATYGEHNLLPEPKKDQFGRVSAQETVVDDWESRAGLAHGLKHLAPIIQNKNQIISVFEFFIQRSLNDRSAAVRGLMLEAAVACLDHHGKTNINDLLPLFEGFLQDTPKDAKYDAVRENVVILMGTLAKHLDKDDAKVAPIIGKLVQALQTPSQQVQEAVANCLPPLMPAIKAQVPTYVNQLLTLLLSAQSYGERRGAAYGLAGMLKGVGMLSLRQLNVLQRLNDAVNNKSDAKQREGALIGYEMLTVMFQKIFEPYSVEILPNLLLCFGDTDANVRQAADDCAKAIMANLTFTGVKMILPKLLERLGEEESWRTKCGSVELLGNMAHCAPKQLSTCLPSIVPKLIEVLSDSHVKVQKAGTQALRHIASVIKNPEIQMITDVLLEALQDPAVKTQRALQVLLETKFVHFIDAPSLALIMPIVQRAFQDRSTEIRKMAAQIMGNMYSLTDQKDLQPYLPAILPGIKHSLLDPVPEVRSVSAKALGTLITSIGENGLNDVIAWLMDKLVSEQSSVDRSGAAQGLSEVFGALGVGKLEKSMPEIIDRAVRMDLSPYVRDGYIMMFIYLPLTFGDLFTPYVGSLVQPVLKALADDSEFVRDTAIKAGQRIVNTYAETAISLFLPELEKGLFDANWRIRFSSVQLLGDLLYKVSGVQGKMTTESAHEDDNFGTEKGSSAIIKALGEERRNKIYSGLYMGRSDVSLQVRQASLHVWKVIVPNTPKTLKEILPTLFILLLSCLASSNNDKRMIAATTLVDIVKKLGERILPDIIPILERGLDSERAEQRQGVCIGLTEIMSSTSRDNIMAFSDSLVPTVRKALMDPLSEVRASAARTFDNLHNMIGSKALEEVALSLLDELKRAEGTEMSERALDGLKQVMMVKSRVLLPFLVPFLTQPPVNINALCKLCCCASTEVLSRHLSKILQTLVQALALTLYTNQQQQQDSSTNSAAANAEWVNECELLLLSIEEADGIRTIINELLSIANNSNEKVNARAAALDMLTWFCSKTESDYTDHLDELTKSLFNMFSDKNEQLLVKAWVCFNSIVERLKGNYLIQRLANIRQAIRVITQFHLSQTHRFYSINTDSASLFAKTPLLPGFCLPKKGISCVLPIFKEGLLNGPPDTKEQSALLLCECIKLSDGDSLKSSVMAITGPLIRVLGERYSWQVKSAILDAIYLLLLKVDITLKPFLPQLQPTFLKNLNDTNRVVRLKSGFALARLLVMNPRLEQVILDIVNYIKQAQDDQVRETILNTLRLCLNTVGSKLTDETKLQVFGLLKQEQYLYNQEYTMRAVTAGALGSLAPYLADKEFDQLFNDVLDYQKYSSKNWVYLQSNSMLIAIASQYCPQRFVTPAFEMKYIGFIKSTASSDRTPVAMSAIRAICYYIDHKIKGAQKSDIDLVTVLAKCINQSSNDIKLLSVQIVTYLSVLNANKQRLEDNLLKLFIPMLVNGTREKAPTVRLASEIALVEMLQLRSGNTLYEQSLKVLDTMKESFQDCVKSLSKESMNANVDLEEFSIDETLIRLE